MRLSSFSGFWTCLAVLCAALPALSDPAPGPGWIDITQPPHSAKGDGVTDNTRAFQDALHAAGQNPGGGTVFVPRGNYLIKGNLRFLPNVTLQGVWELVPDAAKFWSPGREKEPLPGSVLLTTAGGGSAEGPPFIALHNNCAVKGITIFYPEQVRENPPKPYPWTIASTEGGADQCTIRDVLMVNPYQAVDFGTHPAGRHFIENLYAHPLYRGIYVDKCYDIGRIHNVHLWPFWGYTGEDDPIGRFVTENAEAFIFGRTDWEYVTNCFAIFYKVGFHFVKTEAGTPNVLLTQSGSDIGPEAVLVDDCMGHAGVSFMNSQLFGRVTVRKSNGGPVRFTGCGFFGATREKPFIRPVHADIEGTGHVSFENCHFVTLDPLNNAPVGIRAAGGTLSVSNCLFMDAGRTHVLAEESAAGGIVLGNTFSGAARIENHVGEKLQAGFNLEQAPKGESGAVIIDDAMTGGAFETEGEWMIGKAGQNYAGVLHWAKQGGGEAVARWRPDLREAGVYAVYVWHGDDPFNDHATDAPYTVRHRDGEASRAVNLREGAGAWKLLGEFAFDAGRDGFVSTNNRSAGNVVADAVKFVKVR